MQDGMVVIVVMAKVMGILTVVGAVMVVVMMAVMVI